MASSEASCRIHRAQGFEGLPGLHQKAAHAPCPSLKMLLLQVTENCNSAGLNIRKMYFVAVVVYSLSHVRLFCDPVV